MLKRTLMATMVACLLVGSTGCGCLQQLFCCPWGCGYGGYGGYGGDCCGDPCGGCCDTGGGYGGCCATGGPAGPGCEGGACGPAGCAAGGCGPAYYGDYASSPPRGCTNCDRYGNWMGPRRMAAQPAGCNCGGHAAAPQPTMARMMPRRPVRPGYPQTATPAAYYPKTASRPGWAAPPIR